MKKNFLLLLKLNLQHVGTIISKDHQHSIKQKCDFILNQMMLKRSTKKISFKFKENLNIFSLKLNQQSNAFVSKDTTFDF